MPEEHESRTQQFSSSYAKNFVVHGPRSVFQKAKPGIGILLLWAGLALFVTLALAIMCAPELVWIYANGESLSYPLKEIPLWVHGVEIIWVSGVAYTAHIVAATREVKNER